MNEASGLLIAGLFGVGLRLGTGSCLRFEFSAID